MTYDEAAHYSLPGEQAVPLGNGAWRPGGYQQLGNQWVRPQSAGVTTAYGAAPAAEPTPGAPAGVDPFAGIDFGSLRGGGGFQPSAFEYAPFEYGGRATPGGFSYQPFTSQAWDAPELQESAGAFESPGAFAYSGPEYQSQAFQAPDMATIAQDPGYQFRLRAGQDALERSAAARGTLLTGGTAKDLAAYQQDMASQEYQRAYDRALQLYQMDDARQFRDYQTEYNRQFGEHQFDYSKQFNEWQAESNRRLMENQLAWDRSLQQYQLNYNRLFGEHQQGYNQARDAYGFAQQDMAREYDRALNEYQMGYNQARDRWQTDEQGRASAASSAERARQEQIDFLMRMAGI